MSTLLYFHSNTPSWFSTRAEPSSFFLQSLLRLKHTESQHVQDNPGGDWESSAHMDGPWMPQLLRGVWKPTRKLRNTMSKHASLQTAGKSLLLLLFKEINSMSMNVISTFPARTSQVTGMGAGRKGLRAGEAEKGPWTCRNSSG